VSERRFLEAIAGGRVLVVGASVSGRAAARLLVRHGATVTLIDDAPRVREEARVDGVQVRTPGEIAGARFDLVVVSPGVRPERVAALGVSAGEVIGELELGYRSTSTPITAITGTNGKSTVTALVAEMLGEGTRACGNLGTALCDVAEEPAVRLVVEASSFQLAWSTTFHGRVASILNITPNHLDYHGSFEAYRDAKAVLVRRAGPGDVLVLPAGDPVVNGIPRPAGVEVRTFATRRPADYRVDAGRLLGPGDAELAVVTELPRRAEHEVSNVLAAWALAEASGGDPVAIRRAALAFRGLPHRRELVATVDGVAFVNDSKATTAEAAAASVRAYERVVLIAGGRTKGTTFRALREVVPRLVGIVAIGEGAPQVLDDLADLVPRAVAAGSMEEAVRIAGTWARPGDTVLLAPAATSWDWYASFEARGDDFRRLVHELWGGG